MRPLAELDAAACRNLAGVVFDIDDTITDDGRLTEASFTALWRLHRAGLRLIAVTGRPLGWCDVLAQLAPVDLAVGENGAGWVWRHGRTLHEGYWDSLDERLRGKGRLETLVKIVERELPNVPLAGDQRHRRVDLAFDVNETVHLPPAIVQRLQDLIRGVDAHVLISSVHAHAFFSQYDKAVGVVRAAREVLGVDIPEAPERWLFIGDSGNDAAAFAYFPISVGVANVHEHLDRLPRTPAFITAHARAGGFAELADHILAARG